MLNIAINFICQLNLLDLLPIACILSGGMVRSSVLAPGLRVDSYSLVEDSILMPKVTIGRRSRIRRAILDLGVAIPEDMEIGYNPEEDA